MPTRKNKAVAGKSMGIAKASKGLGKASTSAFKKKGNSKYCPNMSKSKL